MERFCNKCGTLVSGDGKFCPQCGNTMDSVVDLSKPISENATEQIIGGADHPVSTPMQTATVQTAQTTYSQTSTYNSTGNTAPMPNYPQTSNVNNNGEYYEPMSVGSWVLTTFLSGLGIIGLILLFVWAFGDTPQPKKNYARAMLIWQLVAVGICVLYFICVFACMGSIGLGMMEGLEEFGSYY